MAQDTGHDERRSCWSASSVPLAVEPVTGGRSSTCSGLREPRGALPPILDGDCPTSALSRSGTSLGTGASLGPSRPFRVRHLTNYELPRRDLLAHVLELRLARLVISLPTRRRHHRSLPSLVVLTKKPTAKPMVSSRPAFVGTHLYARLACGTSRSRARLSAPRRSIARENADALIADACLSRYPATSSG